MDEPEYDYRSCESLFGYAADVHTRSRAICRLCGYGRDRLDFDQWRQLTVEHVIGRSQGGYRGDIRRALNQHLPEIPAETLDHIAGEIDEANTVTACSSCNAMTSRDSAPRSMDRLIEDCSQDSQRLLVAVKEELESVLKAKRSRVELKLRSVRAAFDEIVVPAVDRRPGG